MPKLSVAEAAKRLGVNPQRIHQRIADGSLAAERIGHQWAIDEALLARLDRRPAGRPLSSRSAWDLVVIALHQDPASAASGPDHLQAHQALGEMSAPRRSRARARLEDFRDEAASHLASAEGPRIDDVAARLRGLLRPRAERRPYRVPRQDVAELRGDARVSAAGVSLPAAGLSASGVVEGYVAEGDLDDVVRDYLLSPSAEAEANAFLHVVPKEQAPLIGLQAASWLAIAADLAEHQGPREVARSMELIRGHP